MLCPAGYSSKIGSYDNNLSTMIIIYQLYMIIILSAMIIILSAMIIILSAMIIILSAACILIVISHQ